MNNIIAYNQVYNLVYINFHQHHADLLTISRTYVDIERLLAACDSAGGLADLHGTRYGTYLRPINIGSLQHRNLRVLHGGVRVRIHGAADND